MADRATFTLGDAARLAGVSRRSAAYMRKVLRSGHADLIRDVSAGTLAVSKAARLVDERAGRQASDDVLVQVRLPRAMVAEVDEIAGLLKASRGQIVRWLVRDALVEVDRGD